MSLEDAYDSRRYVRVNRYDTSHLGRVARSLTPAPGAQVLEVGCGRGYLTRDMRERLSVEAIGIDVNPNVATEGVTPHLRQMAANELSFDDAAFDHIVAVHVIEHIPELTDAFAEFARVLRPGGTMLAIYPAEPVQGLYAIPTSVILYRNPFKARQVHCHKLNRAKVRRLGEDVGLQEVSSAFTLWTSPQYVSVFQKP